MPKLPDSRPQWVTDWMNRPGRRPDWASDPDFFRPPAPGTPAPSPEAAAMDRQMAATRAATERGYWMAAHRAWMDANGLTCAEGELDRWYDNVDRDRLPMPGVLQWQTWIAANYTSRSYGDPPAAPLDATAARQIQSLQQENRALRQARQDDAAHIAWAENEANRVGGELADRTDQRDQLNARLDQQYQRFSDQAAELAKQKEETARLTETGSQQKAALDRYADRTAGLEQQVADKDTAIGQLKEKVSQLELANRNLTYKVQHKESVIAQLEAGTRQAADAAAGTGNALAAHEQVIGWQKEKISGLEAENQELAALTGQLQARIDRLTSSPERHRRQLTAGTGTDHG